MSTGINVTKQVKILDEGSLLTSDVSQIDFTGEGVTSTTSGNNVTVSITGLPKVQTIGSSATVTPTNLNDLVAINNQTLGLTLANPSGSWVEGQSLMIRLKDDGLGARSIGYGTNYRAIGVTLPTTTVLGKTTYLGIIYNSYASKWDVIGVTTEA